MIGPEILQAVPPGHLNLHVPLVALSPALLASVAGIASRISPHWQRGIATTGCVAAWLLLALALLPGGAASAYARPLANGWLAFDHFAIASALLSAAVAAYVARRLPPWWQAQMVAISLVIPLIVWAGIRHA